MYDDDLQQEIDKTINSLDYLKAQKKKSIDKIFSVLRKRASLKEVLNTYSKVDLDTARKALNITGLSNYSKDKLIIALENKLKEILPSVLELLTDREYKILKKLISKDGVLRFTSELEDELLYLRKLCLVGAFTETSEGETMRYIFIPSDIFDEISGLCNDLRIVSKIKLNERINKVLKGLLYHYGVLEITEANEFINRYLKNPMPASSLEKILTQNFYKEYGIGFESIYWCHNEVFSPYEIVEEHNNRTAVDYLPLSEAQVLAAAEEDFRQWGKYDRLLLHFLTGTFDITTLEAEDFIESIKMDFRSGNDFEEIVHELSRSFDLSDFEQVKYMTSLLENIYNGTGQWFLKGHSPQELAEKK